MKKWIYLLVGFVAISIVGYLTWNNEDGKQREAKIVQEYQAIKHPPSAKQIHYELKRKFVMRWIRSEYRYSISNDEVKKYYDQEFKKNGWEQIPYNSKPGYIFYGYVKDNLIVVLGEHKDYSWTLTMHYVDAKY